MWYNMVGKDTKMDSSKSRTFTASIEMLDSMVVLMLGDDFATHKGNFVSLAGTDEDAKKMGKLFDGVLEQIAIEDSPSVLGLTIFNKEAGCMPFIYLKESSIPVLVHELVHATNYIIRFHGLTNGPDHDKLQAKMMEYLMKVFWSTTIDWSNPRIDNT